MTPCGVIRPIFSAALSTNQTFLSDALAMPSGPLDVVGIENWDQTLGGGDYATRIFAPLASFSAPCGVLPPIEQPAVKINANMVAHFKRCIIVVASTHKGLAG